MISRSSGLSVSREIQGGMGSKLSMLLVLIAAIVLIVTSEFGGGRLNHSNPSREEQQSQDKAVQEVPIPKQTQVNGKIYQGGTTNIVNPTATRREQDHRASSSMTASKIGDKMKKIARRKGTDLAVAAVDTAGLDATAVTSGNGRELASPERARSAAACDVATAGASKHVAGNAGGSGVESSGMYSNMVLMLSVLFIVLSLLALLFWGVTENKRKTQYLLELCAANERAALAEEELGAVSATLQSTVHKLEEKLEAKDAALKETLEAKNAALKETLEAKNAASAREQGALQKFQRAQDARTVDQLTHEAEKATTQARGSKYRERARLAEEQVTKLRMELVRLQGLAQGENAPSLRFSELLTELLQDSDLTPGTPMSPKTPMTPRTIDQNEEHASWHLSPVSSSRDTGGKHRGNKLFSSTLQEEESEVLSWLASSHAE